LCQKHHKKYANHIGRDYYGDPFPSMLFCSPVCSVKGCEENAYESLGIDPDRLDVIVTYHDNYYEDDYDDEVE
jgi:hypothetical protein